MVKRMTVALVVFMMLVTGLVLTLIGGRIASAALGDRTLYWGSQGDDVRQLQVKLKNWGYYDGPIDGIYGPKTYNAVLYFQRKNGLKADGVVGPQTFAALGVAVNLEVKNVAYTKGSISSNDLTLLAKAVYGEARGEPYVGQVAVAAVILNRVESPQFPNTVAGVIFEPGAFTAVSDGQFYLTPNEEAYKAARDALNGWDPTGGALYYFNPATATSSWIWSRPHMTTIGKHRFLR